MRIVPSRFSDWVVGHPIAWGVSSGIVLVLLGVVLGLAPIVVVAAATFIAVVNIVHARRRGYCPHPAGRAPHAVRAEAGPTLRDRSDD